MMNVRKNFLFIVYLLIAVPVVGSQKNIASTKAQSENAIAVPTSFWKPKKVARVSAGVGLAGYLVSGAILPSAAAGVACFKLTEHFSRRGLALAGESFMNQCNQETLAIAQVAQRDPKEFVEKVRVRYGLPKGLTIVHKQLKADKKKLEIAAQNFELCSSVCSENLQPHQIEALKSKKQQAQSHIKAVDSALALLVDVPISKL